MHGRYGCDVRVMYANVHNCPHPIDAIFTMGPGGAAGPC
jgi:hypothetical protein